MDEVVFLLPFSIPGAGFRLLSLHKHGVLPLLEVGLLPLLLGRGLVVALNVVLRLQEPHIHLVHHLFSCSNVLLI